MEATLRQLVKLHTWLFLVIFPGLIALNSWGDPLPVKADIILFNAPYIELGKVAGQLGMKYQLSRDGTEGLLSSSWTKIRLNKDSRLLLLNNYKVYLGYAVAAYQGGLYLSTHDYDKAIKPLLTPQVFSNTPVLKTIVIDPGHGGPDPGCINNSLGMIEKDLTLDLARRLKTLLESRGFRVYLTRDSDVGVVNKNRAIFANQKKADLFVCLHFNSVDSRSVKGIETYTYTPKNQPSTARSRLSDSDLKLFPANKDDAWSLLAGFYVQRQLIKSMGAQDRGLKRARFSMMTDLQCPGLLVEGGFFSHYEEAKKIQTIGHRIRLAEAITAGIVTYQKTLERIANPDA